MKDLVLAIYMTPQGPKLESKLDPRFALRVLAGVCEDLREEVAVDVAKASQQRIEVVQSGDVIVGKSG